MRSTTEPADRDLTLGAPIRPPAPAAPAPTPVAPGVVRNADGTLSTAIPDPAPLWIAPVYPRRSEAELQGIADAARADIVFMLGY